MPRPRTHWLGEKPLSSTALFVAQFTQQISHARRAGWSRSFDASFVDYCAASGSAEQQEQQLDLPSGVAMAPDGGVFVSDERNHRIMHWPPGATEGRVVAGGHGRSKPMSNRSCKVSECASGSQIWKRNLEAEARRQVKWKIGNSRTNKLGSAWPQMA